jgi:hypothetical protein
MTMEEETPIGAHTTARALNPLVPKPQATCPHIPFIILKTRKENSSSVVVVSEGKLLR